MNKCFGFDVVLTPDQPKLQLAPGDYITPAYRKEIDAWLVAFLGTHNTLADGQALIAERAGIVYMNPRTHTRLLAETRRADHLSPTKGTL